MAALLFLTFLAPVWAQESFRATHFARLDGESERPDPVSSTATGIAIMRLDTAAKRLEYRISVGGLQNITAAHFHAMTSGPDSAGQVVFPIELPNDFTTNHTVTGVWENISNQNITRLQRSAIYINFHTTEHPAGEIRGNVERIPNLIASLSGVATAPQTATGDALILLDPVARRLDYLVTYSGLSGEATAAHFRRGAAGETGEIAQPINLAGREGRGPGTWSNISEADMALLLDRKIYVNIETAANSSGEIRGQVIPIEVYTAAVSPQNEVEVPTNSTSAGTGFLLVAMDDPAVADLVAAFVFGGTTGPVQAAHIHVGELKAAGPVIRPVLPFFGSQTFWTLPLLDRMVSDSLYLFRNGSTYVNFHTAQWAGGELRGQLVPAQYNLVSGSSAVIEQEATSGSRLSATVDRNSGEILFQVGAEARGSSRSVALYSSIGTRVLVSEVSGDRALMTTENLASGLYFAQLLVDGRPMGICRVMVTR